MGIGKYSKEWLNSIPEDEPVFLIRAQDQFSEACVVYWANMAREHNLLEECYEAMLVASNMRDWPNKKLPSAKAFSPCCNNCDSWDITGIDTISKGFGFCSVHGSHTSRNSICASHPRYNLQRVNAVCKNKEGEILSSVKNVPYDTFVRWSRSLLSIHGGFSIEMTLVHDIT